MGRGLKRTWLVWSGCAVLALGSLGQEAPGRASLVCDQPVYEFGERSVNDAVTHTFVLRNAGTQPVHLLNVRTSCGCTTAALATNVLAPGQTTDLLASLSLLGRRGQQRKTIYVESDDPYAGNLRLELVGAVRVTIEVQPEGLHFGSLARDGEVERSVVLRARSNVTFHVRAVRSSSQGFEARAVPHEDGRRYEIAVRSVGPRPGGTSTALIQVETDLADVPVVNIPVTVFTVSDIVAAPATLMLVQGATNETHTYYLNLSSPAGKPFKVIKVDPPRPDIACTVAGAVPDRYRIELKVSGWLGELQGKSIRIETDLESMREVMVPLRVIAGPGAPETPERP